MSIFENWNAEEDYERDMTEADYLFRLDQEEDRDTEREEAMRATRSVRRVDYEKARKTKVGQTFSCPGCAKNVTKRSYQHTFCSNKGSNNCKDKFWNSTDAKRSIRALTFA